MIPPLRTATRGIGAALQHWRRLLWAVAFLLLAIWAGRYPVPDWEGTFVRAVQSLGGARIQSFFAAVSWFGDMPRSWVIGSLGVAGLLWLRRGRAALGLGLGLSLGGVLTAVVKHWIRRPRPSPEEVRVVFAYPHSSFPSGHVVFYTVLCGFAFLWLRRIPSARNWAWLCILAVLSVGTSRVYLGAHWPSDVIGGILLGISLLAVMEFFLPPRVEHRSRDV